MPDRTRASGPPADWSTYALFGIKLKSDYPFGSFLTPAEGPPDLTLTSCRPDELPNDWVAEEPTFVSPVLTPEGTPIFSLFRGKGYDV